MLIPPGIPDPPVTQSNTPPGTAVKAFVVEIRATIISPEGGEIILDDLDGPVQSKEGQKAGEEEMGWRRGERDLKL